MLVGMIFSSLLLQGPRPEAVCVDLKGKTLIPLSRAQPNPPKATVLIFYLAHCPISQKLTPEINRIHKEFSAKGVKFYMVHEDLTLTSAEVAKEAKAFALTPPIVIDKWRSQKKMSGVMISPEAVVYDSKFQPRYKGRINDLFYGLGKMRPKARTRDLRDAIANVVAGKAPANSETQAIGCILPKS
ncbi:MAG: redoxin domain-containing protein [Chlorobia bacterium]|nr:redoxin domain-containing protein [Fimbriimonadaceae bacterium]